MLNELPITEEEVEALVKRLRRLHDKIAFGPAGQYFIVAEVADIKEAATALESLAARPQTVTEAFNRGAREGWMRCGTFHIDINFEARESELTEVERRWPLAAAPPPTSQWQTMESAPKDGTRIILAYDDGGVVEGKYLDNSDKHPVWAGFVPRSMWPQKAGVKLTHWQPLPTPPPQRENT